MWPFQLHNRYKEDDGSNLVDEDSNLDPGEIEDRVEKAVHEEFQDIIAFSSRSDLERFNPVNKKYWEPSVNVSEILKGFEPGTSTKPTNATPFLANLPPDPMGDDEFYR